MYAFTTVAILLVMAITLLRALKGPTLYDRILSVNTFGTATVLFIAVLGFLTKRPEFMDVALVYAMINFIGTIALMKFTKYGDLGQRDEGDDS